jgi:hypothetical protein
MRSSWSRNTHPPGSTRMNAGTLDPQTQLGKITSPEISPRSLPQPRPGRAKAKLAITTVISLSIYSTTMAAAMSRRRSDHHCPFHRLRPACHRIGRIPVIWQNDALAELRRVHTMLVTFVKIGTIMMDRSRKVASGTVGVPRRFPESTRRQVLRPSGK